MGSLLSYGGLEAWFKIPEWWLWFHLVATLVGYFGTVFFRKLFLWLLVGSFILGLFLSPAMGASAVTGIEVFFIDVSTVLIGFVFGLAFYSPLKEKFY